MFRGSKIQYCKDAMFTYIYKHSANSIKIPKTFGNDSKIHM